MSARFDKLRVRQLDEALAAFQGLRSRPAPRGGWIRTIRDALGMSARQLAVRMGKSKTTVLSTERNETKGTVQLDSLQDLADALDCDLVYAVIPRTSLQERLDRQAREIAAQTVSRVSTSKELEARCISEEERARQIDALAEEILCGRKRDFWDSRSSAMKREIPRTDL